MKPQIQTILLTGLLAGGLVAATAQTNVPPAPAQPAPPPKAVDQAVGNLPAPVTPPAAVPAPPVPAVAPAPAAFPPPPVVTSAKPQLTNELRLNFRGVPLDMVLNYLSDAAGFTIVLEAPLKGTVDVWSNHPVSKDDAVDLLNQTLNKNGLAALRNDKTLTIVTREEAKKRDIPVKSGYNPDDIPKNDEIVTQIIPIRYINATQLIKDLQPLLPTGTSLTANEAGNALVITDTQTNIRRMAEIVNALDTSVASTSAIKVFPLRYADAKELATTIKELFQTDSSSANSVASRLSRFFSRGGPPGFPGGGPSTGSGSGSGSGGRPGAGRVSAVADERSNSLVVAAPSDMMSTVEQLVKEVDVDVEDITELKVFRLKNSDPVEMAEVLSNLFPDQTRSTTSSSSRFGSRFGSFGGPPGGDQSRRSSGGGSESERAKKQGQVIAVPDRRTASVIVTASRDVMRQIETMIKQLDEDPAKTQKVFVYPLENADVQQVQAILQNLFQTQDGRSSASSRGSSQNSALTTRAQQQSQTQSGSSQSGRSSNTGIGGGIGGSGNIR